MTELRCPSCGGICYTARTVPPVENCPRCGRPYSSPPCQHAERADPWWWLVALLVVVVLAAVAIWSFRP